MARQADYPRIPIDKCLQAAEKLLQLGESASLKEFSEALGMRQSGTFLAIVNAAVKYELLVKDKDQVKVGKWLYERENAPDAMSAHDFLIKAFLSPPPFMHVSSKKNQEILPLEDVKNFFHEQEGMEAHIAEKIGEVFIESARYLRLYDATKTLRISPDALEIAKSQALSAPFFQNSIKEKSDFVAYKASSYPMGNSSKNSEYQVIIEGPELNTTFKINNRADLSILKALLDKLERSLNS